MCSFIEYGPYWVPTADVGYFVAAGFEDQEFVFNETEPAPAMPSPETHEQDVQTEDWTSECGINTDDDWELVMKTVKEHSAALEAQCKSLEELETQEEAEHKICIKNLRKMKEEKKRECQTLLEKIESVRVKLELNNSKTMRKNFTTKIEELTAEKERLLENNKRLVQELEDADKKLKTHLEEQNNEKLTWEREITALKKEKERVSKLAEEANQATLKDEILLLESQRDLVISLTEDWITDAEKYIGTLRSDPSPQRNRLRLEWDKNVAVVRNQLSKLQVSYSENIKRLQMGQQLDSLPTIPSPTLPSIPMIPLLSSAPQAPTPVIRSSMIQPPFRPNPRLTPPLPVSSSQNTAVFPSHTPAQRLVMPSAVAPSSTMSFTHPTSSSSFPSASSVTTYVGVPAGLPAAAAPTGSKPKPTSQSSTANPQPADKLGMLLERLGSHFPKYNRSQLMRALQQIKNDRGTMAGMSIDDITQQLEQKLMLSERQIPGPIAPPSGSRHHGSPQRGSVQPSHFPLAPSSHVFPPRAPQAAPIVRKLCLMCQKHVEPGTQYNTNCTHTLHKECISVWLQTSKNNSCPFCPSK